MRTQWTARRGRQAWRAFSLVELLMVIGIVALLISILLPAIARAKEAANRTVCAANLRNWGYACHAFAAEHKGYFPPAYRSKTGAPFPSVLKVDDTDVRDGVLRRPRFGNISTWRRTGVDLGVLTRYGLMRGTLPDPNDEGCYVADIEPEGLGPSSLVCPSSASPITAMTPPELDGDNVIWGHYMYVGGLRAEELPAGLTDQARWSGKEPAVRVSDKGLARRVLAADEVYFSGGKTYAWDLLARYRTNHRRRSQGYHHGQPYAAGPDFQNVLFGDGHVEGLSGHDAYQEPLTADNYAVYHWFSGAYFYW